MGVGWCVGYYVFFALFVGGGGGGGVNNQSDLIFTRSADINKVFNCIGGMGTGMANQLEIISFYDAF